MGMPPTMHGSIASACSNPGTDFLVPQMMQPQQASFRRKALTFKDDKGNLVLKKFLQESDIPDLKEKALDWITRPYRQA